tara:strand:+ start:233 stop:397 length:165 start_codon:yes stop_codon:yes gene_type:complete
MLVNLTKDELKEIVELISTNNQYNDDTEDVEYWDGILNKLVPILNSCTCKEDTK